MLKKSKLVLLSLTFLGSLAVRQVKSLFYYDNMHKLPLPSSQLSRCININCLN